MQKKAKVTAKDVARLAGVSTATVSMILNGQGRSRFPEKTCRRVLDACNELGYVKGGIKTATADEKVLVAITPSLSNLYYVHLVEAMERRAKELGYGMLAFDTFWEMEQEQRILRMCNSFPIAGVLFAYPSENVILLQQTVWNKPIVYVYDKNLHTSANVLGVDNIRAGEMVAEYLLKLGHERIAFLTSTLETKQVIRIRRFRGLRNHYASQGYDPEESVRLCSPDTEDLGGRIPREGYELGYLLMKQLIERQEPVTAVVAVNDMMAFGAMDAITDSGMKVPHDYSVVGYDNVSTSKYKGISLTSVECYSTQTGREAVELLVKEIEGGSVIPEDSPDGITRIEYFPKLILRKSTGPRKNR